MFHGTNDGEADCVGSSVLQTGTCLSGKSHGWFEVQANKWQSRTLKPDLSDLKLDHFPLLLLPPFSPLTFVRSWGTVENR